MLQEDRVAYRLDQAALHELARHLAPALRDAGTLGRRDARLFARP
jgi:hypothetical protein